MSHRRQRVDDVAADVRQMRETATLAVQQHAAQRTPDVHSADVEAICNALGDISLEEAIAALDELQIEAKRD
jgi:hypothetical protein